MILSVQAVYNLARAAHFDPDMAINVLGCLEAESGFDVYALGINKGSNASADRGICQINSYWHKEVTNEQCFVPEQALVAMYKISGGSDLTPWYGWTVGRGPEFADKYREFATDFEWSYQQTLIVPEPLPVPEAGDFAMSLASASVFRRMGYDFKDLIEEDRNAIKWLAAQI